MRDLAVVIQISRQETTRYWRRELWEVHGRGRWWMDYMNSVSLSRKLRHHRFYFFAAYKHRISATIPAIERW